MPAPSASDLTLGNYLKIVSQGAVYNQLSDNSEIWNAVKKRKKSDGSGRQINFLLRSAYGAAAAGFVAANGGAYPDAAQAEIAEGTALLKDFALTVEVERTLIAQAQKDFARYGDPLVEELRCKTIALSRQLSAAAYRDGTGVLGTVSGTPTIDANGRLVVTLATGDTDKGYVRWFAEGDKVIVSASATDQASATGGQRSVETSAATEHMSVYSRDDESNKVVLEARTSAGAKVTLAANNNVAANDIIRRYGNILDAAVADGTDYASSSYDFVGLESLSQNDGRTVNGIVLSGAVAGTRYDAGANPIDSQHFQRGLSKLMVAVGAGTYKYNKALMSWDSYDNLVESREVDRRFQSIQDNKRGVTEMAYVHGKNTIMFSPDEFCRDKRIFILPDSSDVIQFHGTDFQTVSPNGSDKFFLRPNATGHDRVMRSYMEGKGQMLSVHSAAILTIHNFT